MKALNTEDRLVLGSLIGTLAGTGLAAFLTAPELFGVTALVLFGYLLAGMIATHSERLAWLLVYGLVAGVLELWVDWLHVVHLRTLVYTHSFGFSLLASPSYMPLGWCVVVAQFGYLALRLRDAWPPWTVVSVITLVGMLLPPWYEEFAASAAAWHYTTESLKLSQTPTFVILGYGGCMFTVAVLALTYYRPRFWGGAILAGLFASAGFAFWGLFWFSLLG